MTTIQLKDEEVLIYSKQMGGTLRFRLDEDGNVIVRSQDIEVTVTGVVGAGYQLDTESDVA